MAALAKQPYKLPPSAVAPTLDFADWVKVTGYWFLDECTDCTTPASFATFISRIGAEGHGFVYTGFSFGSVTVAD
ncbi:unnamed protein product [Zymoseptoria tritici ST99CH_1A5]|uniref:Uncharacterized protein n=1 Tax=Zymoseptoria tritici ST99CH_1A5 TaxID=1276529 RepID=A0A1Y6M196_ZYMTR|nr:unnamed protein product [Zymoseptoria tritici ST99CH_1A5]